MPNAAKMMVITSTVKTLHVQSAVHFEAVGLLMLVSVFHYFHNGFTIFPKLALNLRLIKVVFRLHTITNV